MLPTWVLFVLLRNDTNGGELYCVTDSQSIISLNRQQLLPLQSLESRELYAN